MMITETFGNIILIAAILIIVFCLIRVISYFVAQLEGFNFNKTSIYLIRDTLQTIIYVIAIIYILKIFGIDVEGVILSLGIVGVAVGFAAQDIISSIMGGVLLLSDRRVKIDDVISIDDKKGIIRKISFRNTVIEDEDGFIITIPNSKLTNTQYTKFTTRELEKTVIPVTIPHEVNVKKFEKDILKEINNHKEIDNNPKPHLRNKGINEWGTLVEVRYFLKEFKNKEEIKLYIAKQASEIINNELKNNDK